MKKILVLLVLLFTIFSWTQIVSAFEAKSGEDVDIVEKVDWDLYIAWGRVNVNAPVDWDLVISGWSIAVEADVEEDLTIFWGNINVIWNVWDDLKIAWGNIDIIWDIDWDLIIAWWNVRIGKDVVIKWDLVAWAWNLVLDWEVKWKAKIWAGKFVLNWVINGEADIIIDDFKNPSGSGVIRGDTIYRSDLKIDELEKSIKGKITFSEKTFWEHNSKSIFIKFLAYYLIIKLIWLFLLASLIYIYFEKFLFRISDNLRKQTWQSFLYWFLIIVWTPILIVLLFVTIIWIPFAIILLLAYIFLFAFLGILNTLVISALIIKKYKIKKLYQKLLIIFWFAFIFAVTNGVNPIVWLFTIWALAIKKIEIVKELRK